MNETIDIKEGLNQLKEIVRRDYNFPPKFLVDDDKELWKLMREMISFLYPLLENRIVSNDRITQSTMDVSFNIEVIVNNYDNQMMCCIDDWFQSLYESYIEEALELELFEVVENLTRFNQIYE